MRAVVVAFLVVAAVSCAQASLLTKSIAQCVEADGRPACTDAELAKGKSNSPQCKEIEPVTACEDLSRKSDLFQGSWQKGSVHRSDYLKCVCEACGGTPADVAGSKGKRLECSMPEKETAAPKAKGAAKPESTVDCDAVKKTVEEIVKQMAAQSAHAAAVKAAEDAAARATSDLEAKQKELEGATTKEKEASDAAKEAAGAAATAEEAVSKAESDKSAREKEVEQANGEVKSIEEEIARLQKELEEKKAAAADRVKEAEAAGSNHATAMETFATKEKASTDAATALTEATSQRETVEGDIKALEAAAEAKRAEATGLKSGADGAAAEGREEELAAARDEFTKGGCTGELPTGDNQAGSEAAPAGSEAEEDGASLDERAVRRRPGHIRGRAAFPGIASEDSDDASQRGTFLVSSRLR